jgi:hypothetical protein
VDGGIVVIKRNTWTLVVLLLLVSLAFVVAAQEDAVDLTPPEFGTFDPESITDIVVEDYPILPEVTENARLIYARGLEAGNNPHVFSKIGDCMTATTEYFLGPFGTDDYDLGDYADLQNVIDYFSVPARSEDFEFDSFANPGLGTASGFNTASELDSIWADPNWCEANESPLACEYRVSKPSFSLVMFGTNDVMFFEADFFDFYLRTIIVETINNGIVPVLYTFPTRPEFPEKTYQFNQVIIKIAEDYDLPRVNLWLAIQDLPNEGVDEAEPTHLSIPADSHTGYFDEEHLQAGYTVRNLITLQSLKILLDGLEETAED